MLVIFFGVMVGVGLYCRKHSTDVNGFVLGGRSVGPWLTAFAYGTSYFSTVIFIGYVLTLWYKFVIRSNTVGNSFLAVYAEDASKCTSLMEGGAFLDGKKEYDFWRFRDIKLESGKIYGLVGEYGQRPMYMSY